MASSIYLFILWISAIICLSRGTPTCRGAQCFVTKCTGAQCSESLSQRGSATLSAQARSRQHTGHNSFERTYSVPYTAYPQQHARESPPRQNPRSITAEVSKPRCIDGACTHARQTRNGTQVCKGTECKFTPQNHPKAKPRTCSGEQCSTSGSGRVQVHDSVVQLPDRAAQFIGEFSDLASDFGSSLGIQLACDVKTGSNEVPSEDALVLQLHLAKGQERVVEELRAQQAQVSELQSRVAEQQGSLLAQQQELLEQQRRTQSLLEQLQGQYSLIQASLNQLGLQATVRVASIAEHGDAHLGPMGMGSTQVGDHDSYAAQRVDMDAGVMELGRQPVMGCTACGADEYCDYNGGRPHCERCTVCPPGFFLVAQCSVHADRICQDRDECLEITNLCGEQRQCLNTPGGFRCEGLSEREGAAGHCGSGYFFSSHLQECQACTECDHTPVALPCSALKDTICSGASDATAVATVSGQLSLSWAGDVTLPPSESPHSHTFPSVQLRIGATSGRISCDSELLTCAGGQLALRQHGLLWADYNLALRHGCRSFVQACLRLNTSNGASALADGGAGDQPDKGRDLSGVRLEQREGRSLQSATVSVASAVEAGQALGLQLRSASHHCSSSAGAGGEQLYLHTSGSTTPPAFSLLWLSHDTGAVAMTAQAVASAHYHTNYRPAFRITTVSDPYVVALTHDERGVRFSESGSLRFVLQQAVYSMGQTCVSDGFTLLAYVTRNGTSTELARAYRHGVHYRDTSISLSAAVSVHAGDAISFEIQAPAQCAVRYFGDDSGISILSLLWVPHSTSASLAASVLAKGLPTGAVRNRSLHFHQTSERAEQLEISDGQGAEGSARRELVFHRAGSASLALELRLIHSCSLLRLTLHRRAQSGGEGVGVAAGPKSEPLAQQVTGQMPEGSRWASVALRASFQVSNGTAMFVTVDCVRGRINQIAHESGSSSMSVLWVSV